MQSKAAPPRKKKSKNSKTADADFGPYLTREQVRAADRLASGQYGIPGAILMENAGRSAAEHGLRLMQRAAFKIKPWRSQRAVIFCGGGNNGGDGYVIARHLHIMGLSVAVYSAVDPARLSGDAALNRAIVEKMKIRCTQVLTLSQIMAAAKDWAGADLLVDALLGTGFSGKVRSPLSRLIGIINKCKGLKLAVDVPSGLDCDTGRPSNATIRADETVTFLAKKIGFRNPLARRCLGRRVRVLGIGAPKELIELVLKM